MNETSIMDRLAAVERRNAELMNALMQSEGTIVPAPATSQKPLGTPRLSVSIIKPDKRSLVVYDAASSQDAISLESWDIEISAEIGKRNMKGTLTLNNEVLFDNNFCWNSKDRSRTNWGRIDLGDTISLMQQPPKTLMKSVVEALDGEKRTIAISGYSELDEHPVEQYHLSRVPDGNPPLFDSSGKLLVYDLDRDKMKLNIRTGADSFLTPGRTWLRFDTGDLAQVDMNKMVVFIKRMHLTEKGIEIQADIPGRAET